MLTCFKKFGILSLFTWNIKENRRKINMNQYDALKVLGLFGQVQPGQIKLAYKKACAQYHPDRNPAGLEMMKLINIAYDALKTFDGTISIGESASSYGEEVSTALNKIITLSLTIEICGAWIWVSGDTKPHKETLKSAGFAWAPKKQCWYFKPSDAKKTRSFGGFSMDRIRAKYGSEGVKNKAQQALHG